MATVVGTEMALQLSSIRRQWRGTFRRPRDADAITHQQNLLAGLA